MTLQEEEEWDEREELNQQKREIEKHDEPKTSELNLKKKEEDLWELGLPLLKRSLLKHTI